MVEVLWEKSGLLRRLTGLVTGSELDASAQQMQGHEHIDVMGYIIHDFSGVTDIVVSDDDIEFMAVRACFALQRNPKVKIAFVGRHPVLHKLMAAFNDSGCSRHKVCHFETLDQAREYSIGTLQGL